MHRIIGIIFLIVSWTSCHRGKSVTIECKEFEIRYNYKTQSLLTAHSSIKRSIKLTDKTNNKNLEFTIEPDIECLDESIFFQLDSVEIDKIGYQNILWIEDPFAFVIVDLKNLKTLYNSHGEDNIKERTEIKSGKNCIGKIRHRNLILDDCTRRF